MRQGVAKGMAKGMAKAGRQSDQLASALQSFESIKRQLQGRRFAVFLDYDGTLTPIVPSPELAVLSEPARETVRRLAGHCTVAVMSGRDLRDVQARVGIDEIAYGGSHGFEISGPSGMHVARQQGREFLPSLDAAEQLLRQQLGAIPGMLIERKKYSIAVHFRLVADDTLPLIQSTVENVLAAQPELRVTHGKKIYELQPDIEWDKGRAMRWLLETLGLSDEVFTVYLGDDITDEDAFRALNVRGHGIGILVRDEPRDTAAQYALEDTDEVLRFLERLDVVATEASA